MMDYFRNVEEDLRSLSVEARKKHPMVKESAERAIVKLRSIREQFTAAASIEKTPGPGDDIFCSQDIINPFLLACNHTHASSKILLISLGAIQRIITWNAIQAEEVPNVLRVLQIQAEGNTNNDVHLKILQTLLLILTSMKNCSYDTAYEDVLAQALWICFHLHGMPNQILHNTASATVRQVITLLFERMHQETNSNEKDSDEEKSGISRSVSVTSQQAKSIALLQVPEKLEGQKRCGYLLFQDLFLMSRGESAIWLKKVTISKELGLELIEAILSHQPELFRQVGEFTAMLREQVCPLMITHLHPTVEFSLLVRVMRLASTFLCNFGDYLVPQTEGVLTLLLEVINKAGYQAAAGSEGQLLSDKSNSTGNSNILGKVVGITVVHWPVVLAIEVLNRLGSSPRMLMAIFQQHDAIGKRSKLYSSMVKTVAGIVTTAAPTDNTNYTPQVRPLKGLDMLGETEEPPPCIGFHAVRLALSFVINCISALEDPAKDNMNPKEFQAMVSVTACPVLDALNSMMHHCDDFDIIQSVLKAYHSFALTCTSVDLVGMRDIGITSICNFCFPPHNDIEGETVTSKHTQSLKTIFNVVVSLNSEIGSSWSIVLRTFEILDAFVADSANKCGSDEDIEQELVLLGGTLHDFFENTRHVSDKAIVEIITELCQVSSDISLISSTMEQQVAVVHDKGTTISTREALSQYVNSLTDSLGKDEALRPEILVANSHQRNLVKEKISLIQIYFESLRRNKPSFILKKLVEVTRLNVFRASIFWPVTAEHLVALTHHSDALFRAYSSDAVIQLLIACLNYSNSKDSIVCAYPTPLSCQDKTLRPMQKLVFSPYQDTREKILNGLFDILQSCGHLFSTAWHLVLDMLQSVAVATLPPTNLPSRNSLEEDIERDRVNRSLGNNTSRNNGGTTSTNQSQLVHIGFKSVRLIVDEFLLNIPVEHIESCISCVLSYALQTEDVNISLTAVNELWSVADFLKRCGPPEDHVVKWNALFQQLRNICLDSRPEVRNCATNTLFSTVATHGNLFGPKMWHLCVVDTIFQLADQIGQSAAVAAASDQEVQGEEIGRGRSGEKVLVVVHHSRNTMEKQWNETRVLLLQGITRVMKGFLEILMKQTWFDRAWDNLLQLAMDAILSGGSQKEVSLAGLQSIQALVQLVSIDGPQQMQGLRAIAGMRVVNGTLEATSRGLESHPVQQNPNPHLNYTQSHPVLWERAFSKYENVEAIKRDQSGDVSLALVGCLVAIYHGSKLNEFSSSGNVERILKIFDVILEVHVFNSPTKSSMTNSLQGEVLRAIVSFAPFPEDIWFGVFERLESYLKRSYDKAYFMRDIIEAIATLYTNAVPQVVRATTFSFLVESLDLPIKIRHNENVINASTMSRAEMKVAEQLWKVAIDTLCGIATHGLGTLCNNPKSAEVCWLRLIEVVEGFIMPEIEDEDNESEDPTPFEYELKVLGTIMSQVQKLVELKGVPAQAQSRVVKLLYLGAGCLREYATMKGKVFADTCVHHLAKLCVLSYSKDIAQQAEDALMQNCYEALHNLALLEANPSVDSTKLNSAELGVVFLLEKLLSMKVLCKGTQSCGDYRKDVLKLLPAMSECITSRFSDVRILIRNLMHESELAQFSIHLMEENTDLKQQIEILKSQLSTKRSS